MKVLVAIKRVVDHNVGIRVKSDHSDVEITDTKMTINPYCEIALEEAVRQKESGAVSNIVAVSIGESQCQEQLRLALALGADRAIHIETEEKHEPLIIAKLLAELVKKEKPELIFTGKQSIDCDNNQTGQMLAALLGVAQGTFASGVEIVEGKIIVQREVDGGRQTVCLSLPAVVTTDLSLNQPRYASLPNIMQAKKKLIETLSADSLGVDLSARTRLIRVELLGGLRAGKKVNDVDELVSKLKLEARVL